MSKEQLIDIDPGVKHETANLYLYRMPGGGLEIRLKGSTHSVVVGPARSLEAGQKTMERLERYPQNLRRFYQHYE